MVVLHPFLETLLHTRVGAVTTGYILCAVCDAEKLAKSLSLVCPILSGRVLLPVLLQLFLVRALKLFAPHFFGELVKPVYNLVILFTTSPLCKLEGPKPKVHSLVASVLFQSEFPAV